jgi:hypothetical protein
MGGLFSKPITREDLDTALNTALTRIEKRLQGLEDSLEAVTDSLLAPDGDQVAKDVTVASIAQVPYASLAMAVSYAEKMQYTFCQQLTRSWI